MRTQYAYNVSEQLLLPYRKLTRCMPNEEQIFQHGHASEQVMLHCNESEEKRSEKKLHLKCIQDINACTNPAKKWEEKSNKFHFSWIGLPFWAGIRI